MVAIPFPTSSSPGLRPGEGAGRIVNLYAAKDGSGVALFPVPGLVPFSDVGGKQRGMLAVGNVLYVAAGDRVKRVLATGESADAGVLQGIDLVTMARNNRSPVPDIVIVTGDGAFVTDGSAVRPYPDPDVGSPNSVSFLDGYFLFTYGDATIRASGLNTTDLNDQSFTKAEARPDGLTRGIVKGRQFIGLGPSSTEFYDNAGTQPFPLARSEVVDTGLFGRWAVAGFEDGWDKQWLMVASDGTVRRWDGYTPTVVSTPDVEASIATVPSPDSLVAQVYTFGGNSVFSLSGPDFTWEHYLNTGEWYERESYRSRRWRGRTSVKAFDRWIVGDIGSSSLMALSREARTEGDDPLVCRAEGWLESFPNGGRLCDLLLDFSTGQAKAASAHATEADPVVQISWSLDAGGNWLTPVTRSLGRQGEFARRIGVSSLGRARAKGVRLRWEVSDPVAFSFRGADIGRTEARRG